MTTPNTIYTRQFSGSGMPWAKFGDGFRRDKRVLPLSHPAWRLYVCGHLEAMVLMRDGEPPGFLTTAQAEGMARAERVSPRTIRELVAAGLWLEAEAGYTIYRFDKFLPTRKELAAERGDPDPVKAEAGRRGVAVREANRKQAGSKPVASLQQTGSPVPEPVPEPRVNGEPNGSLSSRSRQDVAGEQEVFKLWQQVTGHAQAKFTRDRQQKVRARLREYPLGDVLDAVWGIALSPYHMGENDRGERYDDLELICRSGSKLEHFRDLYRAGGPPGRRTGAEEWLAEQQGARA